MLRKPKIKAALATCSLLFFAVVLVVFLAEKPVLLFSAKVKSKGAAIAIRDNVRPFEKFGSRLFTWSNLHNVYEHVIYLTEYSKGEKHLEFVRGLDALLNKHDHVDIFLLAHANEYFRWVMEIDSVKRKKIRLVYNTGCSGNTQKDIWLELGARTYVAHKSSESISPVFYFYFLRRWCAGQLVTNAVQDANKCMEVHLNRLHVPVDPTILSESRAETYGKFNYTVQDE